MAEISPDRQNIFEEEVSYRAAVSEATFFKIGASINHINRKQSEVKRWDLNGPYSSVTGIQYGVDGAFIAPIDLEIWSIQMWNFVAGISGNLDLDIKKTNVSGSSGSSIFTVRPSINFSAGNYAYFGKRTIDNVVVHTQSNVVIPTFISHNVDAGEMLTMDVLEKQYLGESAGLIIQMRPR
jgi:hypothetical protein